MDSMGQLENGKVPEQPTAQMGGNQNATAQGARPAARVGRAVLTSRPSEKTKMEPMEIMNAADDSLEEGDGILESLTGNNLLNHDRKLESSSSRCMNMVLDFVRPQRVGNMHILCPDYFPAAGGGWGVLGPHWFGPVCVWLILVVASHFCLRTAHHYGTASVVLCYLFLAVSTYYLSDVCLRDPGICRHQEIPDHLPADQASLWRWCDFCRVYQPPDGAHCPDCNVCIAGYDHHCVWMGTCIGRNNYRSFVRFNCVWLYYLLYAFFWLMTFGPLVHNK